MTDKINKCGTEPNLPRKIIPGKSCRYSILKGGGQTSSLCADRVYLTSFHRVHYGKGKKETTVVEKSDQSFLCQVMELYSGSHESGQVCQLGM